MEDSETEATTNELEVVQMFGVDTGGRVDLEGIVVVRGILEQTVERVEHLVREQEEELAVLRSIPCGHTIEEKIRTERDLRNRDHPLRRT